MLAHLARLLGTLFSIKPNEWEGVLYFFFVLLIFSFGASFARSIGMSLLVGNLGGENLPIIFISIELSVMFGSLIYAHYTKKVTGLSILGFFFLSTAVFSIVVQILFLFNELFNLNFNWIYGFFFVGFYFFYILISIHVGTVVASYFTAVQVKRVMALINAGMPIGGAIGGSTLVALLGLFEFQPQRLLFILGLACLSSFGMLNLIRTRLTPVRASIPEFKTGRNPFRELVGTFKYVISSKLMIFMALGAMFFIIGSKLLEYEYQSIIYPKVYPDDRARTTFLATYEVFANLGWLFIQLFITSRLIVTFGVGVSNLLHPILTAIAGLVLFLYFSQWYHPTIEGGSLTVTGDTAMIMLGLGIFAQFINQEMKVGLRTPANNLLFNAIPPNQWGTNKAFLNGIIFPISTVIASVLIMIINEQWGNVDLSELSGERLMEYLNWQQDVSALLAFIVFIVSLFAILVGIPQWMAYNAGVFGLLNRELFHRRNELGVSSKSNSLKQVIEEKLASLDHYHVIAALEMIRVLRLNYFATQVGNLLLRTKFFQIKEHCINTLSALPQTNTNITYLIEALKNEKDEKVIPLILRNLAQFKTVNFNTHIEKLLKHDSPAVFVEACLCLYTHPLYPRKQEIERKIQARLKNPDLPQFPLYLYALGELRQPRYSEKVLPFLDSPDQNIRLAAFNAYIRMLEGQLDPHKDLLIKALESPLKDMKLTALRALKECQPLADWQPIIRLLGARDRTLVNESKELLRLNLNACRSALVQHAFSPKAKVQERFEILSLIYHRLSEAQQKHLRDMADDSLKRFIRVNGLLKIHLSKKRKTRTYELISKVLQEIAENHLLNVLTVITYASEQNLEFFQRVSRGLLSPSRANQGNALEVLSNAGERYLAARVLRYFDERSNDLQSVSRIHVALFGESLRMDENSYISELLKLDNDMLRACLYYIQKERTGRFKLEKSSQEVRIFLVSQNGKSKSVAITKTNKAGTQKSKSEAAARKAAVKKLPATQSNPKAAHSTTAKKSSTTPTKTVKSTDETTAVQAKTSELSEARKIALRKKQLLQKKQAQEAKMQQTSGNAAASTPAKKTANTTAAKSTTSTPKPNSPSKTTHSASKTSSRSPTSPTSTTQSPKSAVKSTEASTKAASAATKASTTTKTGQTKKTATAKSTTKATAKPTTDSQSAAKKNPDKTASDKPSSPRKTAQAS